MKKYLIILLALLPVLGIAKKKETRPDISIPGVLVENMDRPLGIDTAEPRFSWSILSDKQNVRQTAYQIIVSANDGEVWNSGKVESEEQLWVPYRGQKLKSGTQCTVKVKVWTNVGESEWTDETRFGIGLLKENHWTGRWIGLEWRGTGTALPSGCSLCT